MPRPSCACRPRRRAPLCRSARATLELLAAVAAERAENVAGHALRVHANQHAGRSTRPSPARRALPFIMSGTRCGEVAERGRQRTPCRAHQLLVPAPILDSSATVTIFSPCLRDGLEVGQRAIVPSAFIISQMTPDGNSPASRARSTAASVCPARTSTPPLARSGKSAGLTRSCGFDYGSIAAWTVWRGRRPRYRS